MEQDNLFELPVLDGIPIMEFPSFEFNPLKVEDEEEEDEEKQT